MRSPTAGLRVFDKVELFDETELAAMRWKRLQMFLRDHVAANPFHRARLAAAKIDPASIRTPEEFRRIPVMRKQDVVADVEAHPPFGSIANVSPEDVAQFVETTGTTGGGREQYLLSGDDDRGLLEMESFGFRWAGVEPGTFVATSFPVTTRAAGRWHQAAVANLGGIYLPLGTYDAAAKLEYLRRLPVTLLVATPSYLIRLERVAAEEAIHLKELGLRSLIVAGEPFTVKWGLERERMWGARLYEQYGSSQRAFASSCERGAVPDGRRGVLHELPHLSYNEVVEPGTGEPVAPGRAGELVVTPFAASRAAPLVRFATGDRVVWLGADACPCGRAFGGLRAGMVERLDDMLKVRGVNLFPSELDQLILHPFVLDYEGAVDIDPQGRERIRVTLEFTGDAEPPKRRAALETIRRQLGVATGLRFEIVEHTGAPLTGETREMNKRRRWRDLRR